MGRKGVSKRKPAQKKGKPLSGDNASGSISSLGRTTSTKAVKLPEQEKATMLAMQGKVEQASDSKKNSRKR